MRLSARDSFQDGVAVPSLSAIEDRRELSEISAAADSALPRVCERRRGEREVETVRTMLKKRAVLRSIVLSALVIAAALVVRKIRGPSDADAIRELLSSVTDGARQAALQP